MPHCRKASVSGLTHNLRLNLWIFLLKYRLHLLFSYNPFSSFWCFPAKKVQKNTPETQRCGMVWITSINGYRKCLSVSAIRRHNRRLDSSVYPKLNYGQSALCINLYVPVWWLIETPHDCPPSSVNKWFLITRLSIDTS